LFGQAQSLWVLGLIFVGISSMLGAINYITTIIQMRAPGMTLFRMPMTIWGMLITAILQAFALPVLTAALLMLLTDRVVQSGFFVPLESAGNGKAAFPAGQPLLWQHLFWFYSHPAVYVMILPAMGMVSDMLSCFSRKPLFGYRPMVFSMCAIAGLGFIVWGHHMFVSGMNYFLTVSFMISTMLIALPSGIKVFNWLATIWGGRLRFTAPMLFSLGFVSMFIIGGLSGIVMATPPVDIMLHDTYYIVAHFHYVLFGSSILGVFGAIYFWFPKMFGRTMSDGWGKLHFFLTFVCLNGTFFPMHFLGARGFPRRYADPYVVEGFRDLLPLNQFITWCAIGMAAAQVIFIANFFLSMFFGKKADSNPWCSNTLEWSIQNRPPHGNFESQPIVHRGPYEYSVPGRELDFWPQSEHES
jgi:cytochrome c oxidase subunit 1